MKKPTLKALTELGADQLAEAVIELARTNEDIARYIARVTSDATTNVKRIKAKISKIRRRRRFIPYAESSAYADRLASLLDDLAASITDPDTGLALLADFYRADSAIFETCDDSSGFVARQLKDAELEVKLLVLP